MKIRNTLTVFGLALLSACTSDGPSKNPAPNPAEFGKTPIMSDSKSDSKTSGSTYAKPSEDALKKLLSPEQYRVTQQCGTEPAFHNEFWDNHREGIYVDVVTGEPLFSSQDKFDSGSGWPSFTKPIEELHVATKEDNSHFMSRTEVVSKAGGSHLGHVFKDGPGPTKLRYCINSASLKFIPVAELESAGYGRFLNLFKKGGAANGRDTAGVSSKPAAGAKAAAKQTTQEAIFAGGCFWGVEELIEKLPGVTKTEVGYTGGTVPNATYEMVKKGNTGHAEAIRVTFDPAKLKYEDLLLFFFKIHDPTTANRQGNDVGTQYRSAIFFLDEDQQKTAEKIKERVDKSGKWKGKVVTEIVPATAFYSAETYHQKYLDKNPGGYTCHYVRSFDF